MRIAKINGCLLCMSARRLDLAEDFHDQIEAWAKWPGYDEQQRLAAELAERYALGHLGIDDNLWRRLGDVFTRKQIVDLGLSIAQWLGLGRFTQVFGLDRECPVVTQHRRRLTAMRC